MEIESENKATAIMGKVSDAKQRNKEKPIWWTVILIVSFIHIIAVLTLLLYPPTAPLINLTLFTWIYGGFGITMGYHRLWSHKAYKASLPLRILLAIGGTVAFQGSARWWCLRHRLHHRYTDSEHDPYDAKRGFWYSHMGWMLRRTHYPRMKLVDSSDLDADPVVRFQNQHFPILALGIGFGMPAILGWISGDALGGFLYGGYVGRVILWHSTWAINSVAHMFGHQDFSNEHSARGNLLLALITHGEGHHNFHHEVPRDYRNGVFWFDYDPTKWLIQLAFRLGHASDLIAVSDQVIAKELEVSNHITHSNELLPTWTQAQFTESAKNQDLLIIEGNVLNISAFKIEHPGGAKLLDNLVGKDATKAFFGILNNHTRSAKMIMNGLSVARVQEGVI